MLIVTLRDGAPGDSSAGDGENRSDGEAGEDFKAAVAVGMVFVSRFGGHPQAEQNQSGHKDVRRRFETVGDQGDGLRGKTDRDFYGGERDADGDADLRGAPGGLFETPHASGYTDRAGRQVGTSHLCSDFHGCWRLQFCEGKI